MHRWSVLVLYSDLSGDLSEMRSLRINPDRVQYPHQLQVNHDLHAQTRPSVMDYEKTKRALDHLQAERQAQNDRLQLAADAKHKLNAALHTQLPISNRVFRAN